MSYNLHILIISTKVFSFLKFLYNKLTIWTAKSVLPVPGGPITKLIPSYIELVRALTYGWVNLTWLDFYIILLFLMVPFNSIIKTLWYLLALEEYRDCLRNFLWNDVRLKMYLIN